MSVTEDDLPTVQTPTSPNVSPLNSLSVDSQSQNVAAKHDNMPTIKVQPFIRGEVTCLPSANQKAPAALRSQIQLLSDFYLSTHKIKIFMSQQKKTLSRPGSPGCCLTAAIYCWRCASLWLSFWLSASGLVVSSQ